MKKQLVFMTLVILFVIIGCNKADQKGMTFEKLNLKEQKELITSEINTSRELQDNVLKKISETFNQHATVINNQAKQINDLAGVINLVSKKQERNNNKLLKLISLYSELAICGVMDGKRKESLRTEINDLINE